MLQYAVVGGMPNAVQTFVDTKQMDRVLQIQRDTGLFVSMLENGTQYDSSREIYTAIRRSL